MSPPSAGPDRDRVFPVVSVFSGLRPCRQALPLPGRYVVDLTHERPLPSPQRRPDDGLDRPALPGVRSEEHTSELQSLMRISYAVFCLKKKKQYNIQMNPADQ